MVRNSFGIHSFNIVVPKFWNSVSSGLRMCTYPDTFCSHLKIAISSRPPNPLSIFLFSIVHVCELLWPLYGIGQAIIFSCCGFYLLLYFFSSPNLSGRRLDVYHTSTHVALVRILNADLKHAAHDSLKIQDAKSSQKSPSGHHHTTLSGDIFVTKVHIDNRKENLLSSNMSSTCPHNMVNLDPLAAEIGTVVVGIRQTLRRWTGHHLYSAGRPSRWALAHISSAYWHSSCCCNNNYYCNWRIRI